MEGEIALALSTFLAGVISKGTIRWCLQQIDRWLYTHCSRYRPGRRRAQAEILERRKLEEEMLSHAQAAGRPIYSDDLFLGHCKSCGALLRGRSWQNADGNCPDCAALHSSYSEREVAIRSAILQAKALNSLGLTLIKLYEREMRKDGRQIPH